MRYKILLLLGILGIGNTVFVSFFVPKIFNLGNILPSFLGIILIIYSLIKLAKPNIVIIKNIYVKKTIIALTGIGLILFTFTIIVIASNSKDQSSIPVDYVIVLGAGLDHNNKPSGPLILRLESCIRYIKKHPGTKIIVSGGQGIDEEVPEAFAMKEYLVQRGIPQEIILSEDKSTSTFENIKNSKVIIQKHSKIENTKVIIITNDFHLFRAKMLASRNGFETYGMPCKTPPYTIINNYLREFFAVAKSFTFDL